MTLEEKTIELQSQFPPLKIEQIIEILKNFKPDEKVVEEVEETPTEEIVSETEFTNDEQAPEEGNQDSSITPDPVVEQTNNTGSDPSDSGDGLLQSEEPDDSVIFGWQKDLIKKPKKPGILGELDIDLSIKPLGVMEKNISLQTKELYGDVKFLPGEIKKGKGDYEYKYEIDKDKNSRIFYYKGPNDKDWINQTDRLDNNLDSNSMQGQMIGVLSELGFMSEKDGEEAYKNLQINKQVEGYNDFINPINDYWKNLENSKTDEFEILTENENVGFYDKGKIDITERIKATATQMQEQYQPDYYLKHYLDNDSRYQLGDKNAKRSQSYIMSSYGIVDGESSLVKLLGEDLTKKFFGYLNKNGLSKEFTENVLAGNFGIYGIGVGKMGSAVYEKAAQNLDKLSGGGSVDAEAMRKAELARQRRLATYLSNFLLENGTMEDNKTLDGYVALNPKKFKNIKNIVAKRAKARSLISKLNWNKKGFTNFDVTNYQGIENYLGDFFPELKTANETVAAKTAQRRAEVQKNGSWDGTLGETVKSMEDNVMSRAEQFGNLILSDIMGFDTRYSLIQQAEDEAAQVSASKKPFVNGKTATIAGKKYILEDGVVYEAATNTPIIDQDAIASVENGDKIIDILKESKETDYSYSGSGAVSTTAGALTGLFVDIYSTKGIGRGTALLKRATGIKSIIRFPQARLDGMLYWSGLGYAQGKLETYQQLIAAGESEEVAGEMSDQAAVQTAILYGGAGAFSPTEKYFGAFQNSLNLKNHIASAVKEFAKKGSQKTWGQIFKKYLPTKAGTFKTGTAAVGENIEETLQGYGESEIINERINQQIGREVLDEEFTTSDLATTAIVSTAVSAAATNIKIPGSTSNYSQLNTSLFMMGQNTLETQKALSNLVKNGEITQQESSKITAQVRAIVNQSSRVPNFVSPESLLKSSIILQEIEDLKNRLKNIDPAFQDTIKLKIQEKQKALAEVVKPELEKSKSRQAAKENAEFLEASFETFTDQDSVDARKQELIGEGGKIVKSVGYGEAITTEDGKTFILINDQVAGEDNVYTTDQHEVLHPFWEQALKGNPDLAISFGKALMNEFLTNTEISGGAKFLAKFQQYINDPDYSAESTWSEVIPLMSEYLASGDVQYNPKQEAWYKRIGKTITSFLKDPTNKQQLNINFNTGKDVFDFLVAYNENTEAGKGFTDAQKKVAKEGAKGVLVEEGFTGDIDTEAGVAIESTDVKLKKQDAARNETEIKESVAKESKRVEDSQEVQRLYDEQGVSAAMDIIEKFKPITSKIVESRSQAPNFDRQLLTDEIETGKRGILDLVMEYKPESGVPLAAYINKFLPARAIEASQRVLGEEFTTDVTEAKGVVAEEVTEVVEEKPTKLTKPSSLLPAEAVTEITEQVKEKIKGIDPKNMTFKKLGDLAPEVIAREIGIPVKKLTDPRANLSKGDATAIQQFVNKNADKLLRILPEGSVTEAATDDILGTSTGVPTGLLKAFYTKGKRSTRGAGLTPFIKNKNISKADFLEAFGIIEGKKAEGFSARSPQAQALKGIASLYGRLVTNEVSRSPEVDLKPEVKQRVAAGKSKAMASKRIDNAFQSAKIEKGSINFSEYNINYNKTLNAFLKDTGVSRMDMTTESGRKRFLEFAVESGLTKKLPPSFWLSLAFTSDSALTEEVKQELKEAGIVGDAFTFDGSSLREFTGNLPFRNTIEVREWISKTGKENFAKETNAFSDMIKVEGVFAAKNNLETQLSNPDFIKRQDNSINELGNIFKLFQNEIMRNADGTMNFEGVAFVGALLSSSSSGQNHFLRKAAPYRFYQKGYMEAGSSATTLEHTMPATIVGKYLFMQALNGSVNENFKYIKNNYFQGPLLKYNDKKLKGKKPNGDKFNYISTMPENWKVTDNVWARYFNINVANTNGGINPADIMLNKKESILDKFNIMSSGLVINEVTKKQIPQVESLNDSSQPKSLASKRASTQQQIYDQGILDKALAKGRRLDPEVKKIRVFDFDDTLATSKSQVIVTMPLLDPSNDMVNVVARRLFKKEFENIPSYKQNFKNLTEEQKIKVLQEIPGKTKKINATQFAAQAAELEAQGATFDFTEFSKVVDGKKGPLFNVAKKIADTRGTEDLFILTARPQDAAGPIKAFMKSLGIDIPLKNITGLGDGTAQAKGMWIAGKAAEGYNDFYFADDATKNVKAVKDVLDQIDVKSRVQVAKASKRDTFNTVVNDMIEDSSGIESFKQFSAAKARTVGENKGRFDWLTMASSAEDFKGLLYSLLGKGKKGEAQYEFLKTNLIDPYNRAEDSITQAKISAANDFMALKEQFPGLPKTLETETGVGKFNFQHALRVYMWTQQGMSIPGLSKADARKLNKFITDDVKLQAFADQLISIQKGKPYPKPSKDWLGGNLTTDIIGGINKVNRKEYQQEWLENVDIIFSPENLNKMEAAYGTRWRKALENTLTRMKAGTNRLGYNDQTSAVLDWVNNSVGAVMFLNTRSALLQTISAVNFINWGDNNIIAAGKAFANQKQFWGDFMTLMNSDYLTQRRNGLKINVSESEIADAVKDSKNKVKAAIAFLLSKGFVLTRYADSFAIASGGATFYRNRLNKYIKEGMSKELATEKAFQDFRLVAEESQQSSSPDKISMQQASAAGRVILNWANTPMQYVRIQKRSLQDLIAGRGDAKTHISRIAYYGVIQNLIFNALQQALFAIGFGDDDDDEEKSAAKKKQDDKKIARVANGMIDSQLKGLGIAGAGMVAVKNTLMKIYEESGKNRSEYEKAAIEALSFSPAISSKYRKIVGGLKSFSWNMKEIKQKGFSLDNPAYLAGAQIITATTNIPIDRVIKKANNIRGIMSEQSQMWQKVSMALGWSSYDVGLPYYGGWDKPVEPTEAERKKQEVKAMKLDTNTAEQTQMLLDLGLDKKQIKALRYEDARVKKIIELQKKKKDE